MKLQIEAQVLLRQASKAPILQRGHRLNYLSYHSSLMLSHNLSACFIEQTNSHAIHWERIKKWVIIRNRLA